MSNTIVVDYGVGNLHSVVKALRHEGADVVVTSDPAAVMSASRLVIPGVGAFGDGMRELRERKLVTPILEYAASGRPLMAICLGMQLLLSSSEEFGEHAGLGIIPGTVTLIPRVPGLKVPHVGWSRVEPTPGGTWSDTPMADVTSPAMMYFVHSYAAIPRDREHWLSQTTYGELTYASAVVSKKTYGFQFHPEKSGPVGLSIVRRFLRDS